MATLWLGSVFVKLLPWYSKHPHLENPIFARIAFLRNTATILSTMADERNRVRAWWGSRLSQPYVPSDEAVHDLAHEWSSAALQELHDKHNFIDNLDTFGIEKRCGYLTFTACNFKSSPTETYPSTVFYLTGGERMRFRSKSSASVPSVMAKDIAKSTDFANS